MPNKARAIADNLIDMRNQVRRVLKSRPILGGSGNPGSSGMGLGIIDKVKKGGIGKNIGGRAITLRPGGNIQKVIENGPVSGKKTSIGFTPTVTE